MVGFYFTVITTTKMKAQTISQLNMTHVFTFLVVFVLGSLIRGYSSNNQPPHTRQTARGH